jgi:protein-disulfide isomerase
MKILYWLVFGLVIFSLSLIFLGEDTPNQENRISQLPTQTAVDRPADAPILQVGAADAPVTITKYMDFKCPLCNSLHRGAMQDIEQDYIESGQVQVTFRNLASLGPDSPRAAQGAYCALEQDVFVEYQDSVYDYMWDTYYSQGHIQEGEFSDVLTTAVLSDIVTQHGGDQAEFTTCLDEETYADLVAADQQLASADGVRGTPSVIVAGELIVGAQPYNIYRPLIEAGL